MRDVSEVIKNSEHKLSWRDRVGIEPTEDDTRLPIGFEDHEGHQFLIRPRIFSLYCLLYI